VPKSGEKDRRAAHLIRRPLRNIIDLVLSRRSEGKEDIEVCYSIHVCGATFNIFKTRKRMCKGRWDATVNSFV